MTVQIFDSVSNFYLLTKKTTTLCGKSIAVNDTQKKKKKYYFLSSLTGTQRMVCHTDRLNYNVLQNKNTTTSYGVVHTIETPTRWTLWLL